MNVVRAPRSAFQPVYGAPCPSADCDCPDCRAEFDPPRCLWCREAVPVDRQSDYCSVQCVICAEGMTA